MYITENFNNKFQVAKGFENIFKICRLRFVTRYKTLCEYLPKNP